MHGDPRNPVHEYDLAIVGGGPGGAAAAILARQRGLRVVLFERMAFPRDRPGETLHPGIEPLLQQLNVLDRFLAADFPRHEGHWVHWGPSVHFSRFGADAEGPWRGFHVWRADFDSILLDEARQIGAAIWQPCQAFNVIRIGGRITGVITNLGDFAAHTVIDASGGGQWLARRASLEIQTHSPPLRVRYGYCRGTDHDTSFTPTLRSAAYGWKWWAPIDSTLRAWTTLTWDGEEPPDGWAPMELQHLSPVGPTRGADVTWRILAAPAGAGYYAVGDAAAVIDPAGSHGVMRAVMSGMFAAHAVSEVAANRVSEADAILEYSQWITGWFQEDVTRLQRSYAELPEPPDWALAANSSVSYVDGR